ncbi:hypothetical protein CEXT_290601 [Caerostris extrusa]|uniref:Uncharacterized protein n=1 Tax=Caerostris extrusa TaxID=172846 RepID=A0AAV4MTK8_CAEEX|nr:hypothetical protein CEXT_290601 [Caerostris extrusa]
MPDGWGVGLREDSFSMSNFSIRGTACPSQIPKDYLICPARTTAFEQRCSIHVPPRPPLTIRLESRLVA